MKERRHEGTKEQTNEGTKERRNEGTKERRNEGTEERRNERANERTNEGTKERRNFRSEYSWKLIVNVTPILASFYPLKMKVSSLKKNLKLQRYSLHLALFPSHFPVALHVRVDEPRSLNGGLHV